MLNTQDPTVNELEGSSIGRDELHLLFNTKICKLQLIRGLQLNCTKPCSPAVPTTKETNLSFCSAFRLHSSTGESKWNPSAINKRRDTHVINFTSLEKGKKNCSLLKLHFSSFSTKINCSCIVWHLQRPSSTWRLTWWHLLHFCPKTVFQWSVVADWFPSGRCGFVIKQLRAAYFSPALTGVTGFQRRRRKSLTFHLFLFSSEGRKGPTMVDP